MNYTTFDTDQIDHLQTYRLIVGSVVPRPIAWVSSISTEGVPNLAPFSFFTCVSHVPPLFSISAGERDKKMKDTAKNIQDTKGYVIHSVAEGWQQKMSDSSANFGPRENEFKALGIETVPSDLVDAPRIKNTPIAMECRFEDMIVYGDEWKTHLVIGRALRWHVREDLMLDNKYIDPAGLRPVGRLGGPNYCRTGDIYQIERPYAPPDEVHPNASKH
ncbi:MAG: flavin reductase family protein [Nitrospinota bacterium]|nr:flavin reductase family protein [Nitrospinota bacterium]